MGKTRTAILFLPVIVVCVASIAVGQGEQWLGYRFDREPGHIVGDTGQCRPELSRDEPQGVQLPQFTSVKPLFGRWSTPLVESGYLWIAVDRTNERGPYDRLFIDSNGDGHLVDETAVAAYWTDFEDREARFGPVKVVLETEDGPITYHLNFETEDDEIKVASGGWYQGSITVGQEKRHCVLIDYNANGAFDDKSLDPDESDRIQVRIDQRREPDTRLVGNYLQVGRELYQLEVARDGAYVKLARAQDVTFGNIRVPESTSEFSAGGENGLLHVLLEKGIGRLPVGKYRIHHWACEHKDDKANRWKLETRWWGKREFEVGQATEPTLKIGELVTRIPRMREKDGQYCFFFDLRGQMGERVELTCNNQEVNGQMHIRNKAGTFDRKFPVCVADG